LSKLPGMTAAVPHALRDSSAGQLVRLASALRAPLPCRGNLIFANAFCRADPGAEFWSAPSRRLQIPSGEYGYRRVPGNGSGPYLRTCWGGAKGNLSDVEPRVLSIARKRRAQRCREIMPTPGVPRQTPTLGRSAYLSRLRLTGMPAAGEM